MMTQAGIETRHEDHLVEVGFAPCVFRPMMHICKQISLGLETEIREERVISLVRARYERYKSGGTLDQHVSLGDRGNHMQLFMELPFERREWT